jgi:hypothetical protein
MHQVIQVIGALLIPVGFVLAQWRIWTTDSWAYLAVNLVGAAILAVLAGRDGQWGFLLLEGVWTIVTASSIVSKLQGTDAPAPAH